MEEIFEIFIVVFLDYYCFSFFMVVLGELKIVFAFLFHVLSPFSFLW